MRSFPLNEVEARKNLISISFSFRTFYAGVSPLVVEIIEANDMLEFIIGSVALKLFPI